MAHAFHQFSKARALRRRHRVTGMAQIMKVQARQPYRVSRPDPELAKVLPPQPPAQRADEDQAAVIDLGEALQVPAQPGTISRGNETVRIPARDFGSSSTSRPSSVSAVDTDTRTT